MAKRSGKIMKFESKLSFALLILLFFEVPAIRSYHLEGLFDKIITDFNVGNSQRSPCTGIVKQDSFWSPPIEHPTIVTRFEDSKAPPEFRSCSSYIFVVKSLDGLVRFLEVNRKLFKGDPAKYAVVLTKPASWISIEEANNVLFHDKKAFIFKLNHFLLFRPVRSSEDDSVTRFAVYARQDINFKLVNFWNSQSNRFLQDKALLSQSSNLNVMQGKTIKISAAGLKIKPSLYQTRRKDAFGNNIYDGYEAKLHETLADSLGYSFEIYTPEDGKLWGEAFPNDTGTGNFREIARQEADIANSHFVVTYFGRFKDFFDFVTPHLVLDVCFMVEKPTFNMLSHWNALIKPLDFAVWISLLVSFLSVASLTLMMGKFVDKKSKDFLGRIINLGGMVLEENLPGGLAASSRWDHERILIGTFLISTFVITCGYKGSLKSFLITETPPKPINTIEQLTEAILSKGIRPLFFTDYYPKRVLRWNRKFDVIVQNRVIIQRKMDYWKEIANGGALMATTNDHIYLSDYDREGNMLGHIFGCAAQYHTALMVQMSSPYKEILSDKILKLRESGILNMWRKQEEDKEAARRRVSKKKSKVQKESAKNILNITHFQSPFYLWILMAAVSCFVFSTELIHFNCKQKQEAVAPSIKISMVGTTVLMAALVPFVKEQRTKGAK